MGPLAGVNPHVPVQLPGVLKRTPTDIALVRSLLGVYPPVNLQIFLHAKHLVTKFTLKRALPGVSSVVPHEPRRNRKRLFAHVALVRIGGRHRSCNNPRHDLPSSLCTLALLLLLLLLLLFGVRFHMACVGTFAAKVDVALLAAELGHLLQLLLAGRRALGNHSRGEASVTLRLIGATGQVDDLLLLELLLEPLVSVAGRFPHGQGRVVEAQLRGGRVVLCLLHQQG